MSRTWSIIIIFNLVLTLFCTYYCFKIAVIDYKIRQASEKMEDAHKDTPMKHDYPSLNRPSQ